jgi:hypothetical protein
MNKGAFEHEEEILLSDGADLNVRAVLEEEFQQYEINDEGFEFHGCKCVITNKDKDKYDRITVYCFEDAAVTT